MENIKHKHHYVFQAYLKNWAKNKKISCYNFRDKKTFCTSSEKIANQHDFYKIRKINDDERKVLVLCVPLAPAEIKPFENILAAYQEPIRMMKIAEEFKNIIEHQFHNTNSKLEKSLNELIHTAKVGVNNMIEDMYSEMESKAMQSIREIISGNLDFYYRPQTVMAGINDEMDSKIEFIYFVCVQYFRTKNMRQKFISNMIKIPSMDFEKNGIKKENIDFENIAHLYFEFLSSRLADNLYTKQSHLTVLRNNTQVPFITSDQPVINLKADYKSQEDVKELIFYYPLSPAVAILLNDANRSTEIELTESEVNFYNEKIASASNEFIFSNDEQLISRYL